MIRPLLALTLSAALVCPPLARGQSRRSANEGQLKAAFIVGFMRFVQWPNLAPDAQSAFVVCVMDDAAVLEALATNASLKVQSRPVRVWSVSQTDAISPCHVLYVGKASIDPRVTARALQHKSILTVADGEDGAGAVIRFFPDGDRLAFEVDLGAAKMAGLDIGSQLLSVARRVVGKPRGRP